MTDVVTRLILAEVTKVCAVAPQQGAEVAERRLAQHVAVRLPPGVEEAAVVISPGSMYGPSGEGFFRISLTAPDERITEAVERMREHLAP